MIFFTSDNHFYHKNIIFHCGRPFGDVQHMNMVMIENWNKIVKKEDTVFHLGDFAFCSKENFRQIVYSLNGKIVRILGNHDKSTKNYSRERFEEVVPYKEITPPKLKRKIVLFHYPICSWNNKSHGSWHLHGHTHGTTKGFQNKEKGCLDVGVDCWDFTPVSLEKIVETLSD